MLKRFYVELMDDMLNGVLFNSTGEEPELWVTNGSYLVRHKLHSHVEWMTHLGGSLHDFTYAYHSGKIFWIDSVKRVIYWWDTFSNDQRALVEYA